MTLTMRRILVALALFAVVPTAEAAGTPSAPPVIVYTHVTVIDGTGGASIIDAAIVVEGERIKSVAPMSALLALPGAKRVDMTGKFALPGLIDSHVHVGNGGNRRGTEAHLLRMLYGGVTAVRDMAGDGRFLADVTRSARLAEIASPDIYYSAFMAGPSFFVDPRTHDATKGAEAGAVPWMQAVTPQTDAVTAVALARGTGAAGIKLYANVAGDDVRRIAAEAHRQGFPIWSHGAVFPAKPSDAIAAGMTSISHAYMLAYELGDLSAASYKVRPPLASLNVDADTTVLPALYAEMKNRGIILDATVHTFFEGDAAQPPDKPKRGPLSAKLARAAYLAGVEISAGTDFGAPPNDPYPPLQTELEALVQKVGMSSADVIRSATSIAAKTFKADGDMGTLEPGKLANIVFVARNPLDDISALRNVVLTVKRGKAYPRAAYRKPPSKILAEDD